MIEKTVIDYLSGKLSCDVYAEIPKDMPDEFVVVSKTGGGKTDHVFSALIAIQSYSNTLLGAATLNETVKEKMDGILELDSVGKCKLNSDYNFTDTSLKRYRYQAVYDFMHY